MQLSVDHTTFQEALNLGLVDDKNADSGKDRHTITRCVGDKDLCQPSIQNGENRIFDGDMFLICSDGLSDVVSIDEMEKVLSEPAEVLNKCKSLLELAIKNCSQDNISIILLEVA
jgi:protein phosphatase